MRVLLVYLVLALAPLSSSGQTVFVRTFGLSTTAEMVPGAVPTSLTCLVGPQTSCKVVIKSTGSSSDPYVCSTDMTASGQKVTIQDGQSTPVTWVSNTLGSTGSATTWIWTSGSDSNCRMFPGGVFIQADGTGATAHLIIKYNK